MRGLSTHRLPIQITKELVCAKATSMCREIRSLHDDRILWDESWCLGLR